MSKALLKASREGRLEHVRVALDSGAEPNQVDSHGMLPRPPTGESVIACTNTLAFSRATGMTAVIYAASANNAECLKVLVAAGGDTNARSHTGVTPLTYAAHHNNIGAARWLLSLRVGRRAGCTRPPARDQRGAVLPDPTPRLVQANAKTLRGLTALHTAVSCHTSPLANLRSHAH